MDRPPLTAEAYFHVRAGISLIFGLSVAHLLRGLVRMVQQPEFRPAYPVHLAWVASSFLLLVHFWWWEVNLVLISPWTFPSYLFFISFACLFYFLSVLLFPDRLQPFPDFRAYFHAERKWLFGLLALIYAADVVDTSLKGAGYLASLGPEYLVSIAIFIGLCGIAMFTENERFHRAFVALNLVHQVSWMLRRYDF
jgi:hypothetical protein